MATAARSEGLGIAGVKGLGGGFGERALQPWGEDIMKRFVREAVDEALKLESALARLRTARRVAILHYAPIQATVEGEPPELYPVPGIEPAGGAAEPLSRGRRLPRPRSPRPAGGPNQSGVPVYNVCLPLLRGLDPDHPPIRIVELPTAEAPVPRGISRSALGRENPGPDRQVGAIRELY